MSPTFIKGVIEHLLEARVNLQVRRLRPRVQRARRSTSSAAETLPSA